MHCVSSTGLTPGKSGPRECAFGVKSVEIWNILIIFIFLVSGANMSFTRDMKFPISNEITRIRANNYRIRLILNVILKLNKSYSQNCDQIIATFFPNLPRAQSH